MANWRDLDLTGLPWVWDGRINGSSVPGGGLCWL